MRNKFKWGILVALMIIGYCMMIVKATAQTEPMSIKKAIDMALSNNRSLRADSLNISITGSKNKEIAGLYLPQVNYSSNMEYNPAIASTMIPGSVAGQPSKDYVPVKFGTKYNMRSGVEVTQTIFKKDLQLQIREAGLQNNIANTKYTLSKEELVYQVAVRYYSLQTNAEMIRTTHFDYVSMSEVLNIAKAQYEAGVLKKIDYESLQINVANMLSQLNQLQTQYKDQLAYFNYLLGLPAANETIISDSIADDLRDVVLGNELYKRTDIRLSDLMIQAKQSELNRINAEKMPSVSTYFKFHYQSQFNKAENAFDNDYMYKSSTVGLSVSVPIYDGNRRKNRIKSTQTQLDQLKLDYKQKKDQANLELFTATNTFNNNREQYIITKENLVLALSLFSSRKALYTEGVTTLMELLDAERELSNARNLHIQALINVQTGWLDLHKANGTLLTDFIKSI